MNEKLIEHLSQFVTGKRLNLFDSVLNQRTRYITLVLEDIFQSHNASAVLRSCECFGIQDVHIIENKNKFQVNQDIVLGANKWLTLFRYDHAKDNTSGAIRYLKNNGYRIVATTPHKNDCFLEELNISKGKIALFLGSELNGLSPKVMQSADEFIKIPMAGFTESLNISVTAAILVYHLTNKLRTDENIPWQLNSEEKQTVKLQWLKNTIKKADLIEKAFLQNQQHIENDNSINSS